MEFLEQMTLKDAFAFGIYVIAYVASIVAFTLSSMFWLRIMVVISSAMYTLYYYIYPAEPLWLDIISEGAFVLINVVMIAVLMHQKSQLRFNEEEKLLFDAYFNGISPFEYVKLLKIAEWRTCDEGYLLATKDRKVRHLSFIFDGAADVTVNGKKVAEVKTGNFVGEVSFKLNKPATATVATQKNTRIVQWSQFELKELFQTNPGMKNCVEALISTDLAKKLSPGNN
jgi:hypothetical protein